MYVHYVNGGFFKGFVYIVVLDESEQFINLQDKQNKQ